MFFRAVLLLVVLCCADAVRASKESATLMDDAPAPEAGEMEVIYFAQTLTSKTTMSAEANTRFLAFIGIATGLNQEDWTSKWLNARAAENLTFNSFALPSYSERAQAWVQVPMLRDRSNTLRVFVQRLRFFMAQWLEGTRVPLWEEIFEFL